ncbi:hypothetical protein VNO77_44702 [Canavalia gladiata]|uniref:Uncharacterized protein n=1 Tax=Canavalia gladiata TaxID=3824 RepID=A0AAN9JYK3_CANGL
MTLANEKLLRLGNHSFVQVENKICGWNNDLWGEDFPTSSSIDDITPNNPGESEDLGEVKPVLAISKL